MNTRYRNSIYNADRGFIFAYVPKVACINWKSVLRYLEGHKDYLDNALAHDRTRGGLHYLDLSGPEKDLLTDPGIKKFSFVRNPYSRTLSAFLYKVEHRLPVKPESEGENHFDRIVREIDIFRTASLKSSEHPAITFEVFLRFLRDSKSYLRLNEHWQHQTILLALPEVKYDFVGRFENISQDAQVILDAMGCDIPFPSQKDIKFNPTNAGGQLEQYYSPVCAEIVVELFREDFVNFNYAPLLQPISS